MQKQRPRSASREADQRLCLRYTNSTIPLLSKSQNFKALAISCDCAARFVSDLVRNPEDRFSHNEAHILYYSNSNGPQFSDRQFWANSADPDKIALRGAE